MTPDSSLSGGPTKRKRLQGACDNCRRKKARCDSSVMPDKRCSNCLALGAECTHLYANQKHAQILNRTPLKTAVEGASSGSLGEYREKMNGLLQAVLSSTYQAPSHPAILRDSLVSLARYGRALEEILPEDMWVSTPVPSKYEPPPPIITNGAHAPSTDEDEESSSEEVDDDEIKVVPDCLLSSFFLQPGEDHFFGPSSCLRLLATALEFKEEYQHNPHALKLVFDKYKRPHFWAAHPWEGTSSRKHQELLFPEADHIEQLVDVYFSKIHPFTPFLHRRSFEQSVRARAYLSDSSFGAALLALCALASRYSNDRRVFDASVNSELGCGYHWFQQVEASVSISKTPTLHGIQACYMAAMYAFSSSATEKAWYLIGMAIRAAQDLGLHRSSRSESKPTILSELRNRLWWAITVAERLISTQCGRPCSIQPWDYDAELPIECDDEYWERDDSALQFFQPPGRFAYATHFIKIIELSTILGSVQRSMYPSRNQTRPGDLQRASLSDLDAALSSWEKSVPSHLRLGGRYNDVTFEHQAVSLWMSFYYVQMLTHRPFISRRQVRSSSVDICINAARACSRVMEGQAAGSPLLTPAIEMPALSMAGIILIMDIWRRDLMHGGVDSSEEVRGVHRCISALKVHEARNTALGRRVDLLLALLAASRLPLPPDSDNRTEPMVLLLSEPRVVTTALQPPTPRHDHSPPSTYEIEPRGPSSPLLSSHTNGHPKVSRGSSRRDASGSDCWLDLLTDPHSLRDHSSHGYKPPPPPPPPVQRRYSNTNGSSSVLRTHPNERRSSTDRYQPFPTSSSARGPSNLSNLRYVNMFHDANEGRVSMDVDENAPASVKRASTLLQCGPNGMNGPGSSASKHATQSQGHSSNSAPLPPLSPSGTSDGHWRNPYVYDVAPS
ncbi:fungal-specific transcription factor domain-containing protein [Coprinopsis sp. MPI-PUGE-AT-0042]|nr:fungal-specific transcription factor domain-containing protein [Coprinopsis sp. MPI-PUGE-AT-0042]